MRVHPEMSLPRLRDAMGEASLLDAEALRDVLLRRGVEDTDLMTAAGRAGAVMSADTRPPRHLRPENA